VARRVKGHLYVDAGAATALTTKGHSLLAAGISPVEGRFERGDTTVTDMRLAAAANALGYAPPKAAVHGDDLLELFQIGEALLYRTTGI